MKKELILRRLDTSSIEMVKAFFTDVFTNEPWNDDWSDGGQLHNYILDLTGQSHSLTLGLFEGEEMVGLSMGYIKHWFRGTEYVIDEFCISRTRQHQGLGTKFMQEIERYIKSIGLKAIFLQTDRNVPAYEFYKKNGFTELQGHVSFAKNIKDLAVPELPELQKQADMPELPDSLKLPGLPETIKNLTDGKPYKTDDTGKSGSKIYIFDDFVLKIVNAREKQIRGQNDVTVEVMRWLDGRLPVPKILYYEADDDFQYLLMSRVPGKMLCDEYYLEHPRKLVKLLAAAFKMLWSVDVTDCPRNRTIDAELEEAKYRVENNLVDLDDAEPETFGKGGFENPAALLAWLEANRPDYEPVLSHGDFCLPNIFAQNDKVSGFIDLGGTGTGDKWRDIALCYRSLKHNFDGTFGGKVYPDFNPDILFEELGVGPNREKLKFYILLDELF